MGTVKYSLSNLVSTFVGALMEDDTENFDFCGHFRVNFFVGTLMCIFMCVFVSSA